MNRQRSTFITLMNTMAKSTELATIALESNGTMLEVQGKYMETVEGKMGKLKATSQTFWSTLINSNAVKVGIDALTGVMETLTKVSEIFGGTATAILGIGAVIAPTLPKIASLVAGLSEAGTVMGGLSALLSSMISPVGIVIAGFSLLAVGVAAVSAAYKDTNERIAEATESLDTFERKQKGIEANQSLLNTYVALNKKLESGNLTLEERESIQQQINEVSGQLGGISSEVNGVLQDGNKTLEEKRGIIQDIINLMARENAEELDKKLDPQGKMNDRYKNLLKTLERAKSLKEELEKENVQPQYIAQYKEDLKYANEQLKTGYQEIEKYNESVKKMGPHAEEFGRSVIKMSDDLESYHKELVSGTEATKGFIEGTDNITASLTPIPNHISRTAEEIEALNDLISGIDELIPTVDLSDINLDYVSDEFIDLSSSIAAAQIALAGFIDTYNALGSNLDLMEDMKTNLEQNGYFTDDMIDKILASGNADLIALLDDEGATWENLISLIDEYKAKQEEAKQQAIDRANEEAKLQDVLKEKHEEEKRRIEEIMELTSKAAETSIKDGNFVDPTDSIKQISQVIEMSNGLKSVIAEINGQKVMINYDENGYFQTMSNVKEITDGTYASMMSFNGTKVVITIDENGKTATYALEKVTELANGTKRALTEIDGKKYVIDFDANDNIADMQEVIDNAQEFSGIMEGLDGKTYRVTFDKETLQQDIQEVTKNIDGTYSLIDESGDHPIEIIMNGDGEVIGKIDGVNTKIDEFEKRKEALNGTSLNVTVEGTEQTVTNLNNITENADGTYMAIGELNGKHVLITFDNKGQAVEYLGEITENTDGTRSAIVELNGKHVLITFDNKGQTITDLGEITENTDGTRSAIVELNGKHVLITFDNKGQTITDLGEITENTDGTRSAIVELNGKHVKITFDNKGNIIGDLEEVTDGADTASTARDNLNKTPFKPTVTGADKAARDLYDVAHAAEVARGQAGEIRITTIHENITRNITQTASVVSKGGAATGALPYSIDIPGEQIFEPVEATQDVVIMANPIADTSEVEAFDMGSEVEAFDMGSEVGGSDGGDGLSAPIADVQPYAIEFKYDSSSYSEDKEVEDLDLELDKYQKINDVLEDYANRLKFINSILNDNTLAYKDRQRYLREEIDLYWQQRDAINALIIEKQKEAKEIQDYLKQYNFQFDENGNILNAMEMLESYQNDANSRTGMDKDEHIQWVKFLQENVEKYVNLTNKDLASLEDQWASLTANINNTNLNLLKDFRKNLVDAIKEERESQKESQISLLDARINRLKAELKSLDDEDSDKLKQRAKIEAELAKWQNDNSVYGKKKIKELQDKINELNKEIKEDEINAEIGRIEAEKQAVEEDYNKRLSDKELYLEADRLLSEKNVDEIKSLLENAQSDFENLGGLLGSSFTEEFMSQIQNALDAMEYLKTGERPSDMKNGADGIGAINTSKPPTSSSSSSNGKDITIGRRVKVTDPNTGIYIDPNTSSSSGTWKGVGITPSDTMYVCNMNNGKVALSKTQDGVPIGWIDIKKIQAFATGGYTGDFRGGKLGLLHPKERVLSAEQTKNFEILVSMLGDLVKNPILQLGNIMKDFKNPIVEANNNIEINNNFNITNNTPFDMDRQNENLTQLMSRELRRFGKITTK